MSVPPSFDLVRSARDEMIRDGFRPDFPPGVPEQLAQIAARGIAGAGLRDLRELPWSSIDNDSSRDLDQIEVAERVDGGILVRIGIADVASAVARHTPIDDYAAAETTTVYAEVATFPMLPVELSTGLTSLNEDEDREAIVIEFLVASDGALARHDVYRAIVRNQAQLVYSQVGPWLEGSGPAPAKIAPHAEMLQQLKLQDEAATALRAERHRLGALDFDRVEARAVIDDGQVRTVEAAPKTRASALIEDFMVAANEVMAVTLKDSGASSIRRVVRTPERWPRIREIAERHNTNLPEQPDSAALNAFLQQQKQADPEHYADLSLSVIKLLGPGEYALTRPGDADQGHFGLATHDYTHSTAPNRRFADLVTQRLIRAVIDKQPAPYTDDELTDIARNCTLKEDAARKVERTMGKRIAAVAFSHRVGQTFQAMVTGKNERGTFVRVLNPPVEGMLRDRNGADVGDRLTVRLAATDPARGYIDFTRA